MRSAMPRSRPSSTAMERWSWRSAGRWSKTSIPPRMPSRQRSWSCFAGAAPCAVRDRESLGPWLHGVAFRISLNARRSASRRRLRERRVAIMEATTDDISHAAARDDSSLIRDRLYGRSRPDDSPVERYFRLRGRRHRQARSTGIRDGRIPRWQELARGRAHGHRDLERGRAATDPSSEFPRDHRVELPCCVLTRRGIVSFRIPRG